MTVQGILVITLLCNTLANAVLPLPPDFVLIAHRGVVTAEVAENSLASLEETIRRGYTHIEVDVRCTKDGYPVCLHDTGIGRVVKGARGMVEEMTLEELRLQAPEERVPSFERFCALCEGRIGLMPDIKGCPKGMEETYKSRVLESMKRHGLLTSAYFIGDATSITDGSEGGKVPLRETDPPGPETARRRYIFCHARDLDAERVKQHQARGLQVIVSINTFHYWKIGSGNGRQDIATMLSLGVDGLQIDSDYDDLLLP